MLRTTVPLTNIAILKTYIEQLRMVLLHMDPLLVVSQEMLSYIHLSAQITTNVSTTGYNSYLLETTLCFSQGARIIGFSPERRLAGVRTGKLHRQLNMCILGSNKYLFNNSREDSTIIVPFCNMTSSSGLGSVFMLDQ